MAVFDDGRWDALYVAGTFEFAGGMPAPNIARWDGKGWSTPGGGVDNPLSAQPTVFDDGDGPGLYIGGTFRTAGGVPAMRVARWGCLVTCYPDCNNDDALNLADFGRFTTKFALGCP